jgi:hypothetical protein
VVAVAVGDLTAVVMELQSDAAAASPELELKMGILLYICLSGGGGGTAELQWSSLVEDLQSAAVDVLVAAAELQ